MKNVAVVQIGADFRRGALDKAGREAVGGVVVMRFGENPLAVLERLREKIDEIEPGLRAARQDGTTVPVKIVPFYDRSTIVHETMDTLTEALTEEAIVAGIVVIVFLLHLRSSLTILPTLPLSVGMSFIVMYRMGVDSNVMSLAGLAIAIGDVADMGIIMSENIYRRLALEPNRPRRDVVREAAAEVGPAIVTAVSNTILSFVPVFALTDQEGKLFKPLAYTKTFAIAASVVLALTLVPVLCLQLLSNRQIARGKALTAAVATGIAAVLAMQLAIRFGVAPTGLSGWPTSLAVGIIISVLVYRMCRERLIPLEENVVARAVNAVYRPALGWVLRHKAAFLSLPVAILLAGLMVWKGFAWIATPVEVGLKSVGIDPTETVAWRNMEDGFPGIGREFMPPLDEGSFLFMPTVLPSGSLTQAQDVMAFQNAAIAQVPEVESVVGKLGRAESGLDPAPVGMLETIILLKPESRWRTLPQARWHSNRAMPDFAREAAEYVWPSTRRITKQEILDELQAKVHQPGVLPTWLQPIQTRIVMLQTGFRAMMGVKIFGADLKEIERIGLQMERILRDVPGATDVVADRLVGKPYIEYEIDRAAAARYGVNVRDIQDIIEIAVGGENLTTSVEGRERYPIRVRYPRQRRETLDELTRVLVPASSGAQVPISKVAKIRFIIGPQEIKSENGLLVGYVTLNTRDRDEIGVVDDAERLLREHRRRSDELIAAGRADEATLVVPPGYYWKWGGQFESQQRASASLSILVPIVLAAMFVLTYVGLGRWWLTLVVFFGIVVSAAGGFLMLHLWGVNLSVAVWVGFIALFGVVDDSSVVMLDFLERNFADRRPASVDEIRQWVTEAGLKRIRPLLMSTATTVVGLVPLFLATGRGSDVMQPMAIPSVGGMAVNLITLFIAPCLYCWVMERKLRRGWPTEPVP